jgi:hypothetical protein
MGKKLKLVLNLSIADIYNFKENKESEERILYPGTLPIKVDVVGNPFQTLSILKDTSTDVNIKVKNKPPDVGLFQVPKGISNTESESWITPTQLGTQVKTSNIINKVFTYNDANTIYDLTDYSFTDSVCWWCCYPLPIHCIPIGMPLKYNEITKKFSVKGIFCSFNCCLAYTEQCSSKPDTSSLLYYMYKKCITNYTVFEKFAQAPPRETLVKFGGCVSIDEYRESFKSVSLLNISEYPLIHKPFEINKSNMTLQKKNKSNFKQEQKDIQLATTKPASKPKIKGNILNMLNISD